MKIWSVVLLSIVGAFTSGCMTHTPRVLPSDHSLTPESALANVASSLGGSSSSGIRPNATLTHFQYWDWESKQMVGSYGNTTTYAVPLRSAKYTDITNVVVETFIWISPGSPFLASDVLISLADGTEWKAQRQPDMRDVCMMLPPFWFFDPKWSVHRANTLADSFLLLRELQLNDTNRVDRGGGRAAFEDAIKKSMSTGGLSSDAITLTYPDGSKETITKPDTPDEQPEANPSPSE